MRSHFRVGTKTTSVLENAYAFHTKTIDYWFYQVLDLWSKGAHVYCFTCFRHHVWKPLKAKGTLQWWCRISSTLEFALFSSRNPSMILRLDKKDHWNSGNQHTAKLFQVWDHRTPRNHSTQWNHIVRSSEQMYQSTFPGI